MSKMEKITINTEYIKLGQALKLAGLVDNGAFAKSVILDGLVFVNGIKETQRGKKLFGGEIVSFNDKEFKVINNVYKDIGT